MGDLFHTETVPRSEDPDPSRHGVLELGHDAATPGAAAMADRT